MELRKKYLTRYDGIQTEAILVSNGLGEVWVETPSGDRIEDAIVIDGGRTVSVRANGRMYLVDLTPPDVAPRAALVNGKGGPIEVLDELGAAAAERESAGGGGAELRADIPGLVVQIKVSAGQTVTKGETAVVLEAMKMQNELPVPGDGVVVDVLVKPGETVEGGALLLRIEPSSDGDAAARQDEAVS